MVHADQQADGDGAGEAQCSIRCGCSAAAGAAQFFAAAPAYSSRLLPPRHPSCPSSLYQLGARTGPLAFGFVCFLRSKSCRAAIISPLPLCANLLPSLTDRLIEHELLPPLAWLGPPPAQPFSPCMQLEAASLSSRWARLGTCDHDHHTLAVVLSLIYGVQ
jgi:hypothetical protein